VACLEGSVYYFGQYDLNAATQAPPSFLLSSGNVAYHPVKPFEKGLFMISKSFWAHGISVFVDGTHGVVADAETITKETAKLLSGVSEADDEDPFADISQDKDKLEENETVLHDCWRVI